MLDLDIGIAGAGHREHDDMMEWVQSGTGICPFCFCVPVSGLLRMFCMCIDDRYLGN